MADLVKDDEIVVAEPARRDVLLVRPPRDPEGAVDRLDDDAIAGRQLLLVGLDESAHGARDQDPAALGRRLDRRVDHDLGLAGARPTGHQEVARSGLDVRVAH